MSAHTPASAAAAPDGPGRPSDPPPTRLAAEALEHAYGSRRVLERVDLSLEPGTVTALMGPNGAGKTTLLRLLAGLLRPSAGRIRLDDRDLRRIRPAERARLLGLAAATDAVPFAWSALELVLMGRAPHLGPGRMESRDDRRRAEAALARLDAAALARRPVTELSAGELQRVMLARALCQDTPVLLADEPTSHLDPAHAERVGRLLRELAGEGRTVACVLHDPNLAARCADRIAFLAGGTLVAVGPPDESLDPGVLRRVYGVASRRVDGRYPAVVLGEDELPGARPAPPRPRSGPVASAGPPNERRTDPEGVAAADAAPATGPEPDRTRPDDASPTPEPPQEQRPDPPDEKPTDQKPTDQKPTDQKPTDQKPTDGKPEETP